MSDRHMDIKVELFNGIDENEWLKNESNFSVSAPAGDCKKTLEAWRKILSPEFEFKAKFKDFEDSFIDESK